MRLLAMIGTIASTFINLFQPIKGVICEEVSNQACAVRKTLVDINKNNVSRYYPFTIGLNKCTGSCDVIDAPGAKKCLSDKISEKFIKVYDMLNVANIPFLVEEDKSCRCECKFNSSVCTHPMQKWNEDLCRCVCAGGLGYCKKGYVWDIDICDCIPKIGNIFSDDICEVATEKIPPVTIEKISPVTDEKIPPVAASLPVGWIIFGVIIAITVCVAVVMLVKHRKRIDLGRFMPAY